MAGQGGFLSLEGWPQTSRGILYTWGTLVEGGGGGGQTALFCTTVSGFTDYDICCGILAQDPSKPRIIIGLFGNILADVMGM